MTSLKQPAFLLLSFALASCSYLPDKTGKAGIANKPECLAAMRALDHLALDQSGTLQGNRIKGVPWLRSDRLSEALHDSKSNPVDLHALLISKSTIAQSALLQELSNLDPSKLNDWQKRYNIKQNTAKFIQDCSEQAIQSQLLNPASTWRWLQNLPRDNDYSTVARIAGLYPLAAIPFRRGVLKEQHELKQQWGNIKAQRWYAYQADSTTRSRQDLLSRYAPSWLIDSNSPANLPGKPYWQAEQLQVDTLKPTSFAFVSAGIWQNKPMTQLNYVIWFSQRPRLKRFDWVAGQHDALVFRVNLDSQGKLIAYDSIHLCGCWYRLFLPEHRSYKPQRGYWQEPVLTERVKTAERMAIYITKDTHQIRYLTPAEAYANTQAYALTPFNELLSLPANDGFRPVFNRQGYVPGSERPERWLFWPMGVRNPGALRRFGDHAISFVGRRYFDEPRLLERLGVAK